MMEKKKFFIKRMGRVLMASLVAGSIFIMNVANALTVTPNAAPTMQVGDSQVVTFSVIVAAGETIGTAPTWTSSSNFSVINQTTSLAPGTSGPTTGTVQATVIANGVDPTGNVSVNVNAGATTSSATMSIPINATLITGFSVSPSLWSMSVGDKKILNTVFTPTNATNKAVAWTSSDPSIATVNATTGEITGVSAGTATITATTQQGSFVSTSVITVNPATAVSKVTINKSTLRLKKGSNEKLIATVSPQNATNQKVTWSSSDYTVASVDPATGVVLGIKQGTATITATTDDGQYKATCSVIVDGGSSTSDQYTVSFASGLSFSAKGSSSKLVSVSINGRTLRSSEYRISSNGGYTYVTLSDEYASDLKAGTHTLTMNFSDGSGSTTFSVYHPSSSSKPVLNVATPAPTSPIGSRTTKTSTSISKSESNRYIVDEKVDEGTVATPINDDSSGKGALAIFMGVISATMMAAYSLVKKYNGK